MCSHRFVSDTSLESVLQAVHAFLIAAPTEFVILYLRKDYDRKLDVADSRLVETLVGTGLAYADYPPNGLAVDLASLHGAVGLICPPLTDHNLLLAPAGGKTPAAGRPDGAPAPTRAPASARASAAAPAPPPTWPAGVLSRVCDVWRCKTSAGAKGKLARHLSVEHRPSSDAFTGIAIDGNFVPFWPESTSPKLNAWLFGRLRQQGTSSIGIGAAAVAANLLTNDITASGLSKMEMGATDTANATDAVAVAVAAAADADAAAAAAAAAAADVDAAAAATDDCMPPPRDTEAVALITHLGICMLDFFDEAVGQMLVSLNEAHAVRRA